MNNSERKFYISFFFYLCVIFNHLWRWYAWLSCVKFIFVSLSCKDCFGKGDWGPNVKEFKRRFSPEYTEGEGPHWLKNLYFIYLLELRAIVKAAPYFESEPFYTGNLENDQEVQLAVRKFLDIAKYFIFLIKQFLNVWFYELLFYE